MLQPAERLRIARLRIARLRIEPWEAVDVDLR